jgi:transposase-like protein
MIQTDLSSFSYKKGSLLPWCKRCSGEHFYRNGKNKKDIQRYKCRRCGYRFVWTSDLPRYNTFSDVIGCAVEVYTSKGIAGSLRGIAKLVSKIFGIKISHEGVRQWILKSKKEISRRDLNMPTTWHVDETYIKIKGKGHWLWIVRCRKTKQVLSWHISKKRFFADAKKVLSDALHIATIVPKRIITDGLHAYKKAIYKVMKWNYREHKKRHVIDSGVGQNWFIERLNREIKRRTKWFSTFQSLEGAKAFFSLWFHHWNLSHTT